MDAWLSDWCQNEGFVFYDHGFTFEKMGLLGALLMEFT